MRLCYLGSANNIHTQRWVKYFAEKGYDIHVISYEFENIDNVKVYTLSEAKNRYLSFFIRYFAVKKLINKIKPDIIHAHYVGGYGWLAALTGFHPFVASAWGTDVLVEPKISRVSRLLTRFALKKADLITCDGENSEDAMINLDINQKKIKIIFHGVDTRKFNFKQGDKEVIKNLFDEGDFPAVISDRSLKPIYDIETLIKAIPLVLKTIPDAKFIIAGEGEQKKYAMTLAKSLNVFDATRFVGQILHDELPKYLSSSDVYVSTSLSDGGMAVSTLEAMACGLPCIVTDVGDNNKWIINGESGFVIPTKNPKTLAEKIIYLIKNEMLRKKIGGRSRKIIEDKQDYGKEMLKMENLYKELIERYKP